MTETTREPALARRFAVLMRGFRASFDAQLRAFLGEKRRTMPGGSEARPLVEALEELVLAGGKRLRPALVVYGYRGCGGDREEVALPLAMSVELLHTYLLVHDDIMDHAPVRRGRPSLHVRFGERHGRRGWPGDPEDFGRSVAILVGDLAHGWAVELFRRVRAAAVRGVPVPAPEALDRAFGAMCEEVVAGQYLELCLPFREVSEEALLRVLRLKSGRYSVERPLQLGALLAGAAAETLARLRAYGAAVGEAFQLRDDLLGTFGDEGRVGKPVGADLAEGRMTFLVHHALRRAPREGRERLERILGRGHASAAEAVEARAIIRDSGAPAAVQEMIEARLGAARRALDGLTLEPEARTFFEGLIAYSRERGE